MRLALRNVRDDEQRLVLGASVTLWAILFGHALLETARDALFLGALPPQRLPWVYLCIAVVSIAVIGLQSRLPLGRDNRRVLTSVLALSAATTAAFWGALAWPHPWLLAAVYVWAGVFATLAVTRFWMVVADVFTITQAKRVFSVIGTGSVLGAITGSAAAGALAEFVPPRHFLLVAAAVVGGAAVLPWWLLREGAEGRSSPPAPLDWRRGIVLIRQRPYVSRLMALMVASTVALTLVDYVFKSVVAERVPAEGLAEFFAVTYLSLNLLSLLLQVTVVGLLLRRVEMFRVMGLTPLLLALTSAAVFVTYTLWPLLLLAPVLAMKAVDGGLRHSLHRTAVETLYVPLSRESREQVKGFVDVVGQRGGQALASVLILLLLGTPAPVPLLGLLVVGAGVAWILLARDLWQHYLDLFRLNLREGRTDTRIEFPELDLDSFETLVAKLGSSNDLEVLAVLELLAEQGRVNLVPTLLLYHPSARVVERAVDLFAQAGRLDAAPLLQRIADHEDWAVRAAVVRARAQLDPDVNRQLREFLDDESPAVRASALVTLVAASWIEGEDARKAMRAMAKGASEEEVRALVVSIQRQPSDIHVPLLIDLAHSAPAALRPELAQAMGTLADPAFVPILIEMLAERAARPPARAALTRIGPPALTALDRALEDPRTPKHVQRHVPRTIHRFEPDAAAAILMRHLPTHPDGLVRFKILRALGGLRSRHPHVRLDEEVLRRSLELTLAGSLKLVDWRLALERAGRADPAVRTAAHEAMVHALEQKLEHARERLFRLLGLLYPTEDWERIHRGVGSERPEDRASGRELIEARVGSRLREPLLALVDRMPPEESLRRGAAHYLPRDWTYELLLESFVREGSLGFRALALYHMGELGSPRLADLVRADEPSEVLREVGQRALELAEAAKGGES